MTEQKGQVEIKLTLDNANFKQNIDATKGQFDGLKNSALSLKGAIGGVFAGLSVGMLVGEIKQAYQAAEESDKIFRQVAQTVKASGDAAGLSAEEIAKMASAMMDLTGIDDEAIMSAQNILLTFRNIGKDVFPQATQAVLDMATTMGTDFNSAALQLGKALNDPVEGLTALRRVGVAFTNEQEDMIKALVKSGRGMEAQKIILEELKKEFGGAAEAAKTASQELSTSFGEMQEAIGRFFTGGVGEKFTNWLNDMVKGFTKLADNIRIFTSEVEKLNETDLNQRLASNRDQQKEIKNNPLYKMGDPWVKEDLAKLIKEEAEIQSRIKKLKDGSANKKDGKPPVFNIPSEKDDSEKEADKALQEAQNRAEAISRLDIATNDYTSIQILNRRLQLEQDKLELMRKFGKEGSAEYLEQEANIAEASKAIDEQKNKISEQNFDRSLKYRLTQFDNEKKEEFFLTLQNEQKKLDLYKSGTDEWLKQNDRVMDAQKNYSDYISDQNKKTQDEIKETGERYAAYISSNLRKLAEGTLTFKEWFKEAMLDLSENKLKNSLSSMYSSLMMPKSEDTGAGIGAGNMAGSIIGGLGSLFGNPFRKFDTGGIIPGYFSNPVPIVAHGSEMVLNPSQQKNLFDLLNSGGIKQGGGGSEQAPNYIYAPQITTGASPDDVLNALVKERSAFFGFIKQEKRRNPNIF